MNRTHVVTTPTPLPTSTSAANNTSNNTVVNTTTAVAANNLNAHHQYNQRYKKQQQQQQQQQTQYQDETADQLTTTNYNNGDTSFQIDKLDDGNVDDVLVAVATATATATATHARSLSMSAYGNKKAAMANNTNTTSAPSIPAVSSKGGDSNSSNNVELLRLRHATNSNMMAAIKMDTTVTMSALENTPSSSSPSSTSSSSTSATTTTAIAAASAATAAATTSNKTTKQQSESSLKSNLHCQKFADSIQVTDADADANAMAQLEKATTAYCCTADAALVLQHQQHNQQNIPLVDIRDDSGEQSDISLESSEDTDSSTPTTADIADLTTNSTNSTMYLMAKGKLSRSPLQQLKATVATATEAVVAHNTHLHISGSSNNGSIADDNLSASIATTTTEVDIDSITVASPNMSLTTMAPTSRLNVIRSSTQPPPFVNSTTNSNMTADAVAASGCGGSGGGGSGSSGGGVSGVLCLTNQHPSAAYLQSGDARHGDASIITASGHKRTLSAASYRSTTSQHPSLSAVSVHSVHSRFYNWIRWICVYFKSSGIGEPSVYHALVVIFLEFFAWGLLTMPVISVLNQTFPDHTFLMNGLVMGIKGILSFLSAPLIGALSDIWGRKFFLLITVFFTCAPIPLMTINSWWFFAMISISGIFAVTFSVVFAYVADVTTVEERSRAYGLVSATFAASLVISPALGAALMEMYSDTLVVALATAIAVLDVFFILVAVPESLPEKVRPSSWGAPISWEQADPFAALRKVGTDHTILMQCVTVLLSYLPEAGQYSCIFVYLKLKMGFNSMEVAIFIAVVGILSIAIQVTLGYLMRVLGAKRTIILGLVLEMLQLLWYGFGSQKWMMWAAGVLAALGSITYPAISAFVSIHSTPDRQGAVQGMVTGMRGLCNGLGPAMFGVIFYLFNVDLNDDHVGHVGGGAPELHGGAAAYKSEKYSKFITGPPFVFGALMVILAILVAIFIPEGRNEIVGLNRAPSEKKRKNRISLDVQYEIETGHKATGPLAPLMRSDSLAQL